MKVVLTENQLNNLILIEEVKIVLSESLNENLNFDILKSRIKKLLLNGVAITSILAAIHSVNVSNKEKEALVNIAKQEQEMLEKERFKQDSITNTKINACNEYMLKALNNQGFNQDSTKLTAEAMVKESEKHNFDLPLLMAAAHLESCFGATPRAQKTNSVFSVGSYDNGKNVVKYNHPNDSIEGYISLLNNDYLINGKTINDLLKPGAFVNKNGHRFASDKNYEKNINYIRNKIINEYPELS